MNQPPAMTELESIELARAYVALSNAHRVDLILPMFHNDAVYCSSAVGEFTGPQAIGAMMRGFFDAYPDVYWETQGFRRQQQKVSFTFSLKATSADGGQLISRRGNETIEFDPRGLITHLEVSPS